jgi:hypothetical protein
LAVRRTLDSCRRVKCLRVTNLLKHRLPHSLGAAANFKVDVLDLTHTYGSCLPAIGTMCMLIF